MQDNNIGETEKVSWNLSQALIMELGNLLRRASDYYIRANYQLALNSLQAVRQRIIQSLDPTERKDLRNQEVELQKLIYGESQENTGFKVTSKFYKIRAELQHKFEDYNEALMDLLEKYGYLINKKEDQTNLNA